MTLVIRERTDPPGPKRNRLAELDLILRDYPEALEPDVEVRRVSWGEQVRAWLRRADWGRVARVAE